MNKFNFKSLVIVLLAVVSGQVLLGAEDKPPVYPLYKYPHLLPPVNMPKNVIVILSKEDLISRLILSVMIVAPAYCPDGFVDIENPSVEGSGEGKRCLRISKSLFRLFQLAGENTVVFIPYLFYRSNEDLTAKEQCICSICNEPLIPMPENWSESVCSQAVMELVFPFKCQIRPIGNFTSLMEHVLHRRCYRKWVETCLGKREAVHCPLCKEGM